MPGFIGVPELILLGLVALLVFGPKRLPEMGRSLGRGMREFKDSVTSDRNDRDDEVEEKDEIEVVAVEAGEPAEEPRELPRTAPVALATREREAS